MPPPSFVRKRGIFCWLSGRNLRTLRLIQWNPNLRKPKVNKSPGRLAETQIEAMGYLNLGAEELGGTPPPGELHHIFGEVQKDQNQLLMTRGVLEWDTRRQSEPMERHLNWKKTKNKIWIWSPFLTIRLIQMTKRIQTKKEKKAKSVMQIISTGVYCWTGISDFAVNLTAIHTTVKKTLPWNFHCFKEHKRKLTWCHKTKPFSTKKKLCHWIEIRSMTKRIGWNSSFELTFWLYKS